MNDEYNTIDAACVEKAQKAKSNIAKVGLVVAGISDATIVRDCNLKTTKKKEDKNGKENK